MWKGVVLVHVGCSLHPLFLFSSEAVGREKRNGSALALVSTHPLKTRFKTSLSWMEILPGCRKIH